MNSLVKKGIADIVVGQRQSEDQKLQWKACELALAATVRGFWGWGALLNVRTLL